MLMLFGFCVGYDFESIWVLCWVLVGFVYSGFVWFLCGFGVGFVLGLGVFCLGFMRSLFGIYWGSIGVLFGVPCLGFVWVLFEL